MARIAGVDLPGNKQVRIALTYIYGIGDPRALSSILDEGRHRSARQDGVPIRRGLSSTRSVQVIEQEGGIEGDLRKEISLNIKRLIEIQSYRGLRHRRSACPSAASAPTPMPAPARVPRKGTVAGKKKVTK